MRKNMVNWSWGCVEETYKDGILVERVMHLHGDGNAKFISLYKADNVPLCYDTVDNRTYRFDKDGTLPYLWYRSVMRFRGSFDFSLWYHYEKNGQLSRVDRRTTNRRNGKEHFTTVYF